MKNFKMTIAESTIYNPTFEIVKSHLEMVPWFNENGWEISVNPKTDEMAKVTNGTNRVGFATDNITQLRISGDGWISIYVGHSSFTIYESSDKISTVLL